MSELRDIPEVSYDKLHNRNVQLRVLKNNGLTILAAYDHEAKECYVLSVQNDEEEDLET